VFSGLLATLPDEKRFEAFEKSLPKDTRRRLARR
jgi:hypothetical protein